MTNRNNWPTGVSGAITEESLAEYRSAGIHFMEMSYGQADKWIELEYTKRAKEYFARAKSYDVTINSVHLPFYQTDVCVDPTSSDPAVIAYILQLQSELIRAAADSGVRYAVIHPSNEPYTDTERAVRLENCIQTIGALTNVAKEAGITLALENLPRSCICRVKEEMVQILDAIPDLRVCFDSNHCLLQTNPDYIRACGNKIVTLHISDYDFINERHLLPGDGMNPWDKLLSALEEVDYNGVFNYEITRNHPKYPNGVSLADIRANHLSLLK